MARLNARIPTPLPVLDAFEYLADFANAAEWDPGVASSERIGAGPVSVGTRYKLGIVRGEKIVPMEYVVTDFERPTRVVLEGTGSNVHAIDTIRFEPDGAGSIVDYTADINMTGLFRLAQPFLGGTFRRIAADATNGIRRTLEARAEKARADQGRAG